LQKDHSNIARSKVGHKTAANILLEHFCACFADLAKIRVAREKDPLTFGQRFAPWFAARHGPDARGQFLIAQRGALQIEAGEFVELHRASSHDETAPGKFIGRIVSFGFWPEKRNAILVFQNRRILERERVPVEAERGRSGGNLKQREPESEDSRYA
jgi:hypothetical protein